MNWKGGKKTRWCLYCGKEFSVYPGGKKVYCSTNCAHTVTAPRGKNCYMWRGGKKEIVCPKCNNIFLVDPGDTRRKFCSRDCQNTARQNRVILVCSICGIEYIRQASRAKRGEKDFCSATCYHTWAVGENIGTWNGGTSFNPYPTTFNKSFKRLIRERDCYICAICNKRGNCVHHINYVKDDVHPKNCITLCRSCHGKTNSNREYWKNYFMERNF
jgi:hypothetical protein